MWKAKHERHRQKYFFVTKQSLSSTLQPGEDVWAFYRAAGEGSYDEVRETVTKPADYEKWMRYLPMPLKGDAEDRRRILSYGELYNVCIGQNKWGRALYGIELAFEESGAGSFRHQVMDEKKGIVAEEFPEKLRGITSVRSTQKVLVGKELRARQEKLKREIKDAKRKVKAQPALRQEIQAKEAELKDVTAEIKVLADAYDSLIKNSEIWNELDLLAKPGTTRTWKHLTFKPGVAQNVANANQKKAKVNPLIEEAKEVLKGSFGPIDPLRNAVIAIDEADLLFGINSEIGSDRAGLIERAIFHSYEVSGTEAVRVVLGTATPAHTSVVDTFRLLNLLLRDKKDRVKGVVSGGAAFEKDYVDPVFSPKIVDLAGADAKFQTERMWRFMNAVKNGISRVDLTRDYDHFPRRNRETVEVEPTTDVHADAYEAIVYRDFGLGPRPGEKKDPSGFGDPDTDPESTDSEPDVDIERPELSKAAKNLKKKSSKLRSRANILLPAGVSTLPDAFRLGNRKYDRDAFARHITDVAPPEVEGGKTGKVPDYGRAPKLLALLRKIRAIDAAAPKDKPPPKHVIVCDAPGDYGAPLVAAALDAAGYPWRPFRRVRKRDPTPKNRKCMKDTVEFGDRVPVAASPHLPADAHALAPAAADSAFVVLDSKIFDFDTEHPGDGSGFAKQRKKNGKRDENTEYAFVGVRKLEKIVGDTADEQVQVAVKAVRGSNIYRKAGLAKKGRAHIATLDEMFVNGDRKAGRKTVAQLVAPLLSAVAKARGENITRRDMALLRKFDLVVWKPKMSPPQKREAVKALKDVFNSRGKNFRSEEARIVVVAPDLTTGTSLFEVEHLHIFDALESVPDGQTGAPVSRDRIQMEGRAWRRCGHKELRKLIGRETTLNVYEYRLNAGFADAGQILRKYVRTQRKPEVADDKERAGVVWNIDAAVQALRTDPADFAALKRIDWFLGAAAFDAEQNEPEFYDAPMYTGYTLRGGGWPLYRAPDTGGLVGVDGEPIESINAYDHSLLRLWQDKKVMWDVHAGAWRDVADREQGEIEDEMASRLEKHVESLLRLVDKTYSDNPEPTAAEDFDDEISRDILAEIERLVAKLTRIEEEMQEERDPEKKLELESQHQDVLALISGIWYDIRTEFGTRADAAPLEKGRMMWQDRALLFRHTRTGLPRKDVGDLRAPPLGWYDTTRKGVVESSAATGFILRKRRARDLWFASHVSRRWDVNVFAEVALADRRIRFATKKSERASAASYISEGFGETHFATVAQSADVLKTVLTVARGMKTSTLNKDVRFFVDILGMDLPKTLDAIQEYSVAPGQTDLQRRLGVMDTLVERKDPASLWYRTVRASALVFGKEFGRQVRKSLGANLVAWNERLHAWRNGMLARSAARAEDIALMGDPGLEPCRIEAVYKAAAETIRYFGKAQLPSPTRVYATMRMVGNEIGVLPEFLIGAFIVHAAEHGIKDDKNSVRSYAAAAITVAFAPREKFPPQIVCAVAERKDTQFGKVRKAGVERGMPEVSVHRAAKAIYDSAGSWTAARALVLEWLKEGSFDTHLVIMVETSDLFRGGKDAPILMSTERLASIEGTKLFFYATSAVPERGVEVGDRVPIEPPAVEVAGARGPIREEWPVQMRRWIEEGHVGVTNVDEFRALAEARNIAVISTAVGNILTEFAVARGLPKGTAAGTKAADAVIEARQDRASIFSKYTVDVILMQRSIALHEQAEIGALTKTQAEELLNAIRFTGTKWSNVEAFARVVSRAVYGLTSDALLRMVLSSQSRADKVRELDTNDVRGTAGAAVDIFRNVKNINGIVAVSEVAAATRGVTKRDVLVWALRGPEVSADVHEVIKRMSVANERTDAVEVEILGEISPVRLQELDEERARLIDDEIVLRRELIAHPTPRVIAWGDFPQGTSTPDFVAKTYQNLMQESEAVAVMQDIGTEVARKAAEDKAEAKARKKAESADKHTRGKRNEKQSLTALVKDAGAEDDPRDNKDYTPDDVQKAIDMTTDKVETKLANGEPVATAAAALDKSQALLVPAAAGRQETGITVPGRDPPAAVPVIDLTALPDPERQAGTTLTAFGTHVVTARAQPLHITSPVHLAGELVPPHVASRLVWTAPTRRRLTLAAGRTTLPTGRVLDPWEEGDEIVAEFC